MTTSTIDTTNFALAPQKARPTLWDTIRLVFRGIADGMHAQDRYRQLIAKGQSPSAAARGAFETIGKN
jgi:hypothetical protein